MYCTEFFSSADTYIFFKLRIYSLQQCQILLQSCKMIFQQFKNIIKAFNTIIKNANTCTENDYFCTVPYLNFP